MRARRRCSRVAANSNSRPSHLDDGSPRRRPAAAALGKNQSLAVRRRNRRTHNRRDALRPLRRRGIVHKTGFNAFADGALDAALRQMKLRHRDSRRACICTRASAPPPSECLERGSASVHRRRCRGQQRPDSCRLHAPLAGGALRGICIRPANSVRLDAASAGITDSSAARQPRTSCLKCRSPARAKLPRPRLAAQKALGTVAADGVGRASRNFGKSRQRAWKRPRRSWRGKWPLKSASHCRMAWRKSAGRRETCATCIRRAAAFEFEKREAAGIVRHQPLGVVAIISPWNNPVGDSRRQNCAGTDLWQRRRLETRAAGHQHFASRF